MGQNSSTIKIDMGQENQDKKQQAEKKMRDVETERHRPQNVEKHGDGFAGLMAAQHPLPR